MNNLGDRGGDDPFEDDVEFGVVDVPTRARQAVSQSQRSATAPKPAVHRVSEET